MSGRSSQFIGINKGIIYYSLYCFFEFIRSDWFSISSKFVVYLKSVPRPRLSCSWCGSCAIRYLQYHKTKPHQIQMIAPKIVSAVFTPKDTGFAYAPVAILKTLQNRVTTCIQKKVLRKNSINSP